MVWAVYMLFMVFGLSNLITGLVIHVVGQSLPTDLLHSEEAEKKTRAVASVIRRALSLIDQETSAHISERTFRRIARMPEVRRRLAELEVDAAPARSSSRGR